MCHSLFNHLYETRLLFLKVLHEEFRAIPGNQPLPELNPMVINHLFHECVANHRPFQEFGRHYVTEYTKLRSANMNH